MSTPKRQQKKQKPLFRRPPKKSLVGNPSCGCACDVCYCGDNCQCTESLCRDEASSVLNSLGNDHRSSPQRRTPGSCCTTDNKSGDRDGNGALVAVVDIGVSGMTCSMCTNSVQQTLSSVAGVVSAAVSLATHSAHVEYRTNPQLSTVAATTTSDKEQKQRAAPTCSYQDLVNAIDEIGFEVIPEEPISLQDEGNRNHTSSVEFIVSGMTCGMCSQAIQQALEQADGVHYATVALPTNTATVEYNPAETNTDTLKETIEDIGYDVVDTLPISQSDGDVDPDSASAPSQDRLNRLLRQQQREVWNRKTAFLWSLFGTVPILFMTMILPYLHISWIDSILLKNVSVFHTNVVLEAIVLWVLCSPIQFGCGWAFYKSSYYGLKQGVMGMDVLVVVGTSASYGYAVWAVLTGSTEYHFFETSAVLICFVLLGKWMQSLAVRRTSQALTQLLALQPQTAILVVPSTGSATGDNFSWSPMDDPYTEQVVPLQSIRPGDIVKVLKGASIPTDGIVWFGDMSVDESMITGESIPVLKVKSSIVLGGTLCVESGREAGASFVKVTGVGAATALSQIVKLVQDAQNRQVPIQNFADAIAGVFVPTVVTLSVVTFMVWYALCQSGVYPPSSLPDGESPSTFSLLFGISCLVISCPCALGLATPTAVMVGTGVGASHGVLMKGGETLELASSVNAVVFDKTGTLTEGKPEVTDFFLMSAGTEFAKDVIGSDEKLEGDKPFPTMKDFVLFLAGSLERNSEHPLAGAVVKYAEENRTGTTSFSTPTNFEALTGRGASGTIEEKYHVAIGNRAFCQVHSLKLDREVEDAMQKVERQGRTAIAVAVDGCICVVMGIADKLKADANSSIAYLKDEMKMDVWMVTGDNRRTARAIARQLQIPSTRVIAEALPAVKVEQVRKLQEQGFTVAMIGDGVNDSPALAEADVGLSLGTGAEIAAEASDMVLVKGNVVDVCTALDLSRTIFGRIQLNLLLSLLYNILSIPVAAGLFYPLMHIRLPPTLAAIAMALSSISVVGSSLALKLYKPPTVAVVRAPGNGGTSRPPRNTRPTQTRQPRRRRGRNSSDEMNELSEPLLLSEEQGNDDEDTERASNLSLLEEGTL